MTSITELTERLTRPTPAEIETLTRHPGDIVVLGASGKMGPSLIGRLRRAAPGRTVYAVARFTSPQALEEITSTGAIPVTADLHDPDQVARLPLAPIVFYLAGRKFGSTGRPDLTWATNTIVPALTGWHYRESNRLVAFSSGNVYPFVSINSEGCTESDATGPIGEYAQSALARERIFDYYSREQGLRTVILRLNYAVDLRYGTLVDVARRVWKSQPVPLSVAKVNAIWQGDANRYAIQALDICESPASILNMTGPEVIDVRQLAQWFADRFKKTATFIGTPGIEALLNNSRECHRRFGPPEVDLISLCEWVAMWIEQGGESLDKPTNFEVVDGRF